MSQPIHLPFLSDLIIFSLLISTPSLPLQKLEVKSVVKSGVKWSLLWLGSLNSNSLGPLMAPVTSKGARPPGQPSGQPCGLWSPSLGQPPNPMGVPGLHSTQTLSQMWHTRPPRVPRTLRAPLRLVLPPSASETPICVPLPRLPWKSSTSTGVPPPPSIGCEQPAAGWWSHTRDLGVGVPPTSAPEGHSQIILMA